MSRRSERRLDRALDRALIGPCRECGGRMVRAGPDTQLERGHYEIKDWNTGRRLAACERSIIR